MVNILSKDPGIINVARVYSLCIMLILTFYDFTGWIYYDVFSNNDKQKWKVHRESSVGNSKIAFESVKWPDYWLTGNGRKGSDGYLCTACIPLTLGGYTVKTWWTAHKTPIISS